MSQEYQAYLKENPYEMAKNERLNLIEKDFLKGLRDTKNKLKKPPKPKGNLVAKPKKSTTPPIARLTRSKMNENLPMPGMLHYILDYKIPFEDLLARTEIIYPKNGRAKVAVDFT